jgi:plastocyanin
MSNETLFYLCGGVLAVSAVTVSFLGLKLKGFPGRAMPIVVLWFVIFVGGATTFAVLHAQDEEAAEATELEQAGKEIENSESEGGFGNEGGALGGETEKGEEEAEEAAEGPKEEEPVGPTEGSQEGGGSQKGAEGGTGSAKQGAAASTTTLQLAADPSALAFDKTELDAKAGTVTIDFDNPSPIPHNVVIEKDGKELAGFEPIVESKKSASADLEAGTYTFLCTVPGHAEAGMEGTLSVE